MAEESPDPSTRDSRDEDPRAGDRAGEPERDPRTGSTAAAARIRHQGQWVEQQLRIAMERGDFDNLPGHGKPIEGLGGDHDPDWWLKRLIEREHVTGVLPPALQLRKDDAELDDRLDRISDEREVRTAVEEFNDAVRKAIYTPPVGNQPAPPVITARRDVAVEVTRWRERREVRIHAQRELLAARRPEPRTPRRRWLIGRLRRPR